jgi:hypothetical protein
MPAGQGGEDERERSTGVGFFCRRVDAGNPKMLAIGACMRKRVMICYGVLNKRTPFDPIWSSRIATC